MCHQNLGMDMTCKEMHELLCEIHACENGVLKVDDYIKVNLFLFPLYKCMIFLVLCFCSCLEKKCLVIRCTRYLKRLTPT